VGEQVPKYCTSCGKTLAHGARYCNFCGRAVLLSTDLPREHPQPSAKTVGGATTEPGVPVRQTAARQGGSGRLAIVFIAAVLLILIGVPCLVYVLWLQRSQVRTAPVTEAQVAAVVGQGRDEQQTTSNEMDDITYSPLAVYAALRSEAYWFNVRPGTVGRRGVHPFSYKVTEVTVQEGYLHLFYNGKRGHLDGELKGRTYWGTWSDGARTGRFELTLNEFLDGAIGWVEPAGGERIPVSLSLRSDDDVLDRVRQRWQTETSP